MADFIELRGNAADALTGERLVPGERVFDTGFRNKRVPYLANSKTRLLKEDTIVWLAEQAGYTLTKGNVGDSGNAKGVDGADVSVGGGEDPVGEVKVGRKSTAKRRSDGNAKD